MNLSLPAAVRAESRKVLVAVIDGNAEHRRQVATALTSFYQVAAFDQLDQAIEDLAKRTHRVLVLTEASRTYGPGAELAARIGETCFSWLDAPVLRVAATDTPTPTSPTLEAAYLPGPARLRGELDRLMAW